VYFFAATFVVYLPVLAYGMLKTHLFDLDVRIKWTVRRGTLALIFLGVFFVIAQLAQNFLSTRYGWAIGGVAAGLLLFAIAPLQRVAERVADAAMPLTQDRVAPGADSVAMFRAAVEMAYADGVVSRAEEKGLAKLAGMCGLSYERALGVREDVERALGLSDPHVKT
jgi:hypothetical protein